MATTTEESFLENVAKHEMNILLDNGVYRHLRFKQPGSSNMWFDVVTWPGFLAYSGDMGSYVFSRVEDMFKFFRTDPVMVGSALKINPSYWGEKLEAVDSRTYRPGYKEYSPGKLRKIIEEHVTEWVQDYELNESQAQALREEVRDDVLYSLDEGEEHARRAVTEFSIKTDTQTFEFFDSWEWDCREYTHRYIWCCYALSWAIRKYDEKKAEGSNVPSEA